MIEPKVIYFCDHKVEDGENEVSLVSVTRGSSDTDTVLTAGLIYEIISVHDFYGDVQHVYYKDYNFVLNQDRKTITWIGTAPTASSTYIVECRHSATSIVQLELEECTKCGGRGWYLSLFENNGRIVRSTSGFEKMVAEFIKLLLTENEDGYGSRLHTLLGEGIKNESEMSTSAVSIIYDCENQYKDIQATSISSGIPLDDTETLKSVSVLEASFDQETYSILLSLQLFNEAGNSAQANIFV